VFRSTRPTEYATDSRSKGKEMVLLRTAKIHSSLGYCKEIIFERTFSVMEQRITSTAFGLFALLVQPRCFIPANRNCGIDIRLCDNTSSIMRSGNYHLVNAFTQLSTGRGGHSRSSISRNFALVAPRDCRLASHSLLFLPSQSVTEPMQISCILC
jgi:hypothetical protein